MDERLKRLSEILSGVESAKAYANGVKAQNLNDIEWLLSQLRQEIEANERMREMRDKWQSEYRELQAALALEKEVNAKAIEALVAYDISDTANHPGAYSPAREALEEIAEKRKTEGE